MWTALDADLPHHPKTFDLSRLMGWSVPETVGRLTLLWLWALRFADDGDLREHGAHRIAGAMSVEMDDAERLLAALTEARWIDREPYLRLHGWWARQGYFLRTRWKDNPSRWQRVQQLYTPAESVAGPVPPSVTDGVAGGVAPVTATAQITAHRKTKTATATAGGVAGRKARQLRLPMGAPELSAEAQAVVATWNQLGAPFSTVRALMPERAAALSARLSEPFFSGHWREALARMSSSSFYSGRDGKRRIGPMNFDFFLRPGSVELLSELPEPAPVDAAAAERLRAF